MFPWDLPDGDFSVLGWSFDESTHHVNGEDKEIIKGNPKVPLEMEVEVAFFDKIDALCIQGHPEWQWAARETQGDSKSAIGYFQLLLNIFMSGHRFKEASNAYSIRAGA